MHYCWATPDVDQAKASLSEGRHALAEEYNLRPKGYGPVQSDRFRLTWLAHLFGVISSSCRRKASGRPNQRRGERRRPSSRERYTATDLRLGGQCGYGA